MGRTCVNAQAELNTCKSDLGTCVNAQAELNTCKSDLEKARAMNADLVICVCVPCVTKPKDSCYVM